MAEYTVGQRVQSYAGPEEGTVVRVGDEEGQYDVAWDHIGTFTTMRWQMKPVGGEASTLTPAEAEQAARRLRRGPDFTAALVGDLQASLNEHEARQVGAIAQAMHQAEKMTTSFTHNLAYHKVLAQRMYNDGVRFAENYWRVDESYVNEHGRRVHNRWPLRYQSESDAQRDIDRGEHWSSYDPKIHTELKMEVNRER